MISRLNKLKDELTQVKATMLEEHRCGFNNEVTNERYLYLLKEIDKES